MSTYPYPKKSVSSGHVIWAYDGSLYEMAAEGMSVADMQRELRDECNLRVSRAAILSVLGGKPRGGSFQESSRP